MAGFRQFGDVVDFFPCPGRCPDACRYAYQRIGTVEVGNFINELTGFPGAAKIKSLVNLSKSLFTAF